VLFFDFGVINTPGRGINSFHEYGLIVFGIIMTFIVHLFRFLNLPPFNSFRKYDPE
jgi:hypothetical protein